MDCDVARRLNDDAGVVGEARDAATGALDHRCQADPDERRTRVSLLTGVRAPTVVVRQFEGTVQGFLVLSRVVGEARGGLVGESLWRNEVPPPHLCRVQLQVRGDQVDRPFQAEGRLRAARAPVGPGRRLIGDDSPYLNVYGWDVVRPTEAMTGEDGHRGRGEEEIRPQVCHNLHP